MVQSFSGTKPTDNKGGMSYSASGVGSSGSNNTCGIGSRLPVSQVESPTSSSDGNVCLFSSTDELLDLELCSSSDLHSTRNYTNRTASSSPTNFIENGFSIDSHDKYYSQEPSSNHEHYQQQQQQQSWCWFSSRYWKVARWRSSAQAIRMMKMTLKRYYLILMCLILVIVSCLIASFVISRSVGDLEADDSRGYGSNSAGQPMKLSSSDSSLPVIEYEHRTVEIIDLIECGKTFAFTKYQLQVKVDKSSQSYQQQPTFLHSSSGKPANSQRYSEPTEPKFILTSTQESPEIVHQEDVDAKLVATDPGLVLASSEPNPLVLDIRPISASAINTPRGTGSDPPLSKESAGLLSLSSGQTTEAPLQSVRQSFESELDRIDPLEDAASSMNLSLSSLNKTVMDCFIVDTEKRYGQKVTIEDNYRAIASTRKVGFKKMLDTIIDCRLLTLSTLPNMIKIKTIPGEQPFASASSSSPETTPDRTTLPVKLAEQESATEKPRDFIGAILGALFQANPSAQGPVNGGDRSPLPEIGFAPTTGIQTTESRQIKSADNAGMLVDDQDSKRQSSYLNMGMSMVSGVVPNTLWCGLGDRASNYSELGPEYKVDACCRAHDHCPIRLKPFATDYGLVNWSMSTRSHCDCDIDFNNCLTAVNSTLSNVIRVLYFRFVGLQCIDVEGRKL